MAEPTDNSPGPIILAREHVFQVGSLEVHPSTRQVLGDGASETLEPRVMQVLVALQRASGAIVTQDELIERCWNGVVVGDNAIHRAISRIRHVAANLGQESFQIETIAKVGYRLRGERTDIVDRTGGPPTMATKPSLDPPGRTRLRNRGLWLAAVVPLSAALLLALYLLVGRPETAKAGPASLAVLPFRTLSNNPKYFAEGVAEEILGDLAREPGLRVAGRTSSRVFGAATADAQEVGRKLDVDYLLEGSVRQVGNRVRVHVALVRTSDGMQRWSNDYAGTLDDIFLIQRRIGTDVADRLKKKLVHAAPVSGPLTTSGEAYSAYLSARKLLHARQSAKTAAAIEILRDVVKRDPNYAPAWAVLGKAIAIQLSFGPTKQRAAAQAGA